ncbi:hypothetical protein K3H46_12235 [Aeromonas veronii]|uniref:hypothetical protein n=1 Tax=Aeromonas veronii TaxID=654 RepID=UPI001F3D12C9|nr:hypothetical protein [Aeromonas veronii]MCF5891786.1 hypothetical protein [Aeromonas veronii]
MFINKIISFNSSWDLLLEKSSAYNDICTVISNINESTLTDSTYAAPLYERTNQSKAIEITPFNFHRCWEYFSEELGWSSYRIRSETPGGLNIYIRHLKDRVATKMMAVDRMMIFPGWVLFESPQITNSEFCDISVLITPMDSVKEVYEEGRRSSLNFSFERALAQLNDLMPINQRIPFVIIGVSFKEEDLEIIDFSSRNSESLIERVLEFPKEHYQAGVGILSYFGEIVKQKYPDIDVKVRIEQDGNIVRMIVDSPSGMRDVVEETLDNYALVVTKKAEPESLLRDQIHIQKLTNKLQMAELEIKQTTSLLQLSERYADSKIKTLEDDIAFLRLQIGNQMHHMGLSQSILLHQSRKEERLLLTQMDHQKRTLDELISDSSTRTELREALEKIKVIIGKGVVLEDERAVKDSLEIVRYNSQETFDDLSEALKNTLYGVSGNIVFQWLQQVASVII